MTNRRTFLKRAAVAGSLPFALGACTTPPRWLPADRRMRHASLGVGGMGAHDLATLSSHRDLNITALCDIDSKNLAAAVKLHPKARVYTDWRTLLQAEEGKLDSVNVSTPDHMHAPIAMSALHLGLHVYCQKPLTHTVVEARRLAAAARDSGSITQMGTQNHSGVNFRRALEVLRSGVTGPVHEVHVWTDRPAGWWPQDIDRPEGADPIPAGLDWDGWLGVAPTRPYKQGAYHAFAWRGFKDFGTGAQGDMGCHLMDPVPWFLGLKDPLTLRSTGPAPKPDSFPAWSEVHYEFAAGNEHCASDGVRVVWHDGGRQPTQQLAEWGATENVDPNAALLIGSEGALLTSPYADCRAFTHAGEVELVLPELPEVNHWHQWVESCFGREEPVAPFEDAAVLTEMALLGNIALEFPGETLAWNGPRLRFHDRPDADAWLHKTYRPGWEVPGL